MDTPTVFLDVDGVLNRFAEHHRTKERTHHGLMGIDSELLALFVSWLDTHLQVQVILSSMWRIKDTHLVEEALFPHNLIGTTPVWHSKSREDEIMHVVDMLKLTRWCALDDMRLVKLPEEHRVTTDCVNGLTQENLDELTRKLGL